MRIAPSAIIYPNVTFGPGAVVEDFCIIGAPPPGVEPGVLPTVIGAGAYIRSHTVIYAGNRIGEHFTTGNKANIRESNEIGDHVSIGTLSVIEHHIFIGSGARMHSQIFIPEYSHLARNVWVGPQVSLTNARYPTSASAKSDLRGPVLEEGCRIGAHCTLLPAVRIGAYSLIGAGSLVTRDIPAGVLAFGAPAEPKRAMTSLAAYNAKGTQS